MIGQEFIVEYSDRNESFKHLLPRSGRVVREVSLEDWGAGWYLLELDELKAKMREDMDNGAQLGWLIDPQNREVMSTGPTARSSSSAGRRFCTVTLRSRDSS